jgi:hypothetical protein
MSEPAARTRMVVRHPVGYFILFAYAWIAAP